jgi:NAD(P)-dependent dehydrogenase (short-subunit alcohol dehydrogenase family)
LNGKLDYIIANAAIMPATSYFNPFSQLGQDTEQLTRDLNDCFSTNVIGNVHLFNTFMPLILRGGVKKVITLSTGMADQDLVLKYGVYEGGPYAVSKAAMNMVIAKFQAEYEKDGVLFMGVCPGVVETGLYDDCKSVRVHGCV